MKKVILISLALLAALAAGAGARAAEPPTYTVLLAGGDEANTIRIWLSPDGRKYVIDSAVPLEVGGNVCANPEGNPNELVCDAPSIAGFEVNAGGGDDSVTVAERRRDPGDDAGRGRQRHACSAAAAPDKLIGGAGDDRLVGGRGDDVLYGGEGRRRADRRPGQRRAARRATAKTSLRRRAGRKRASTRTP